MCFSASASFGASAFLALIGAYGILKLKKTNRYMLALIPILFALQQACEGISWIALARGLPMAYISSYAYLFFALIVWPIWIPLSLYVAETRSFNKRLLLLPLIAGIGVALYYMFHLVRMPIIAEIQCSHIMYDLGLNNSIGVAVMLLYGCATVMPLFVSSIQYTTLLGVLFAGSYFITYFFYNYFLTSIWCFFAALLSAVIVFIVSRRD